MNKPLVTFQLPSPNVYKNSKTNSIIVVNIFLILTLKKIIIQKSMSILMIMKEMKYSRLATYDHDYDSDTNSIKHYRLTL